VIRCQVCGKPALVVHDVGACGYSRCAHHLTGISEQVCLKCGSPWIEPAATA
jgi:hypothetical protein